MDSLEGTFKRRAFEELDVVVDILRYEPVRVHTGETRVRREQQRLGDIAYHVGCYIGLQDAALRARYLGR